MRGTRLVDDGRQARDDWADLGLVRDTRKRKRLKRACDVVGCEAGSFAHQRGAGRKEGAAERLGALQICGGEHREKLDELGEVRRRKRFRGDANTVGKHWNEDGGQLGLVAKAVEHGAKGCQVPDMHTAQHARQKRHQQPQLLCATIAEGTDQAHTALTRSVTQQRVSAVGSHGVEHLLENLRGEAAERIHHVAHAVGRKGARAKEVFDHVFTRLAISELQPRQAEQRRRHGVA